MRSLRPPVPTSLAGSIADGCCRQLDEYIEACIGSKRADLVRLRPLLELAYRGYAATQLQAPTPSTSLNNADGTRLFDCYESGGGVDRAILDQVRQVADGYCPYCSLRMRPKPRGRSPDRDHFLPRSIFPEFSILSVNIVVACDDCNAVKSNLYVDPQGRPIFLHPYFDALLTRRVLVASASVVADTMQISFAIDANNLDQASVDRVFRHIDRLGLFDRLADEATYELAARLPDMVKLQPSEDAIRRVLTSSGESLVRTQPNHPVGLALLAVAQSVQLSKFVTRLAASLPTTQSAVLV